MEVEERPGYLFIVESGRMGGIREVQRYQLEVDEIVRQTGIKRALIDARGEVGDAPADVREAMWEWLLDPSRGFEVAAFVLPPGMAVARVNMTALSRTAWRARRRCERRSRPTVGPRGRATWCRPPTPTRPRRSGRSPRCRRRRT